VQNLYNQARISNHYVQLKGADKIMIKMTLADITKITSANTDSPTTHFEGVSTDTRTVKPGNLFIPIRGEQFDGHDFIDEAYKKGAAAAVVDHPADSPIPQIQVADTLLAFGKISQAWRDQFSLPIVGVTGSNGKTTLKNMIAAILQAACQSTQAVLATEGNLNNNIGVPIMLCRLNKDHRYAVIEMGMNHAGEIAYLTKLAQPQVAIVNNAAEAHLEGLKDVAGVARAKGEIFLGLKSNGTAILNRDDAHFDYWKGLVTQHNSLSFGFTASADVRATMTNTQTTIHTPRGDIEVVLPLLGKHNVMNALAATAATLALNIELEAIKKGLESVHPAHGRMEQYVLPNGARVIDDTYNANPFSLQAAINTLATFTGEKIIVLGDMRELGPTAKELHFASGEKMRAAGIDRLFTLGELSAATTEAFGTQAHHFTDREALITALKPYLKSGVTVLVKGSRSMKMEKILEGIIPENQLEKSH
jgi:UDP-N-acetylmuramoyl-tripeptide--D-alanyl-D-alanine ligase